MAGKNIHVVYNGYEWQVKQVNTTCSSGNFDFQKQALKSARNIDTRNGQEVAIDELDERIREKLIYSSDIFHHKGNCNYLLLSLTKSKLCCRFVLLPIPIPIKLFNILLNQRITTLNFNEC